MTDLNLTLKPKEKITKNIDLKKINEISNKGSDKVYGQEINTVKKFILRIDVNLWKEIKGALNEDLIKGLNVNKDFNTFVMNAVQKSLNSSFNERLALISGKVFDTFSKKYNGEEKQQCTLYFKKEIYHSLAIFVNDININFCKKQGKFTRIITLMVIDYLNSLRG